MKPLTPREFEGVQLAMIRQTGIPREEFLR